MVMDRLSLAALDSAKNDYESVSSVAAELAEFIGEPLSEEKLFSTFRALEAQGLVGAYCARPEDNALVPTRTSENDLPSNVWFITSAEGRRVLECEWEPTFAQRGNAQ